MRSALLCLLAVAAPACNWVFGIEATLQADAAPPGEAARPTARLTYLVAVTDEMGVPSGTLEHRAISPVPMVQAGRLGQPLIDVSIDDTGTIVLPEGYDTMPWRLVYKIGNEAPREIQWTTTLGRTQHAIVPIFGRLDRNPIPGVNTTLTMTPPNGPANHLGTIVYTTGVWTQSVPVASSPGPTFTQRLKESLQLSGPEGAPDHTKNDLVVLVDYTTAGACRVSNGSASFRLALTTGASTTIDAEPWTNSARAIDIMAPASDKVRVGVAASVTVPEVSTIVQAGPAANALMPAFTQKPGAGRLPPLALDGPLMFAMLDCTNSALGPMPPYNLPDLLSPFPQLAQIQVFADRTVPMGGPTLTHGLVAVRQIPASGRVDFVIDLAIPAPPFLLGALDLSTVDAVGLAAGSDPLGLTFGNEDGATRPDYYEVRLHQVTGASTTLERVYTIVQPTLTIDRSVFATNSTYVFEIRAFNGAPGAAAGDFTSYLPTQASAVVWTRTFTTM